MNIDWNSLVSVATAVGVLIAAFQLRTSSKIAQSEFEDSIDQQYRALARGIPVDALIGKSVSNDKKEMTRELIYNYLDLCNEQIFLRRKKRIRKDTWVDWCAGIESNLAKLEFEEVWSEVKKEAPQTFTFLERLEKDRFKGDPTKWK
ncbi:hypothetical protein GCM10008090_27650 [Arenicella chitinivorans]|uniref:Uncharacterized protein n=1 Tax=Arenicella chitinivorans TaxID=1329800 RepID=A0A918RXK2_9GAMM|nr:hypothetical protein [Arenicella chitinivorans]GHA16313.1 hypothetical protein GCM10008090_27650 [Arenicella chitinivorans]